MKKTLLLAIILMATATAAMAQGDKPILYTIGEGDPTDDMMKGLVIMILQSKQVLDTEEDGGITYYRNKAKEKRLFWADGTAYHLCAGVTDNDRVWYEFTDADKANYEGTDLEGSTSYMLSFGYFYRDHAYVDLGLPSGTLWATCNIGADYSSDSGDYFAWGEIAPKEEYTKQTYKLGGFDGGGNFWVSCYITNPDYRNRAWVDGLLDLLDKDNAAKAIWGGEWHMPTFEHFNELYNNCTWSQVIYRNKDCMKLTGPNGNYIYLPCAGGILGSKKQRTEDVIIWSRRVHSSANDMAWALTATPSRQYNEYFGRHIGIPIRPIIKKSSAAISSPSLEGNGATTNNSYYTIDGRRLPAKPTQKGIYILRGKKVVIK